MDLVGAQALANQLDGVAHRNGRDDLNRLGKRRAGHDDVRLELRKLQYAPCCPRAAARGRPLGQSSSGGEGRSGRWLRPSPILWGAARARYASNPSMAESAASRFPPSRVPQLDRLCALDYRCAPGGTSRHGAKM